MRPVPDGQGSIQVLVNRNRAAGRGVAEAGLVDLPRPRANGDCVVFRHDSFRLYREDPVQVGPAGTPEGGALLFSRHAELLVELPDILLAQKSIGAFHSRDSCETKFLRQAPLPGSETALRSAPGLW